MLFSFYVLHSFLSLQEKEEAGSGQEQNHKTLLGAGKSASCLSFSLSVQWETLSVLFVFKAYPEKREIIFPCVSNSIWMTGFPSSIGIFFINSQFVDAFVSQVHWGRLEPLASITKTHRFLGSLCLELFSTDIKGPLSSSEGCDRCQNPHKPSP